MFFNNIKISVIIPVYNPDTALLKEALNSCLNQTVKNIEIILIDDGSKVSFKNDIKNLISLKNIKFIRLKQNQGAGYARNIGIKKAKGEFIAFLDGDDYFYSSDSLEKLYDLAKKTNLNVIAGIPFQDNGDDFSQIIWSFKDYINLFSNKVANIHDYQICYGFWSFLYNRKFLVKNNLFFNDLKRFQDPIWLFSVLNKCENFYGSDVRFYVHRVKNMLNFNWDEQKLKDYYKGITYLVRESYNLKLYDLHTFLYRKSLFWEFPLIQKAKDTINLDLTLEANNLINSFNFGVITENEPELPVISSFEDYKNLDIKKFDKFNY